MTETSIKVYLKRSDRVDGNVYTVVKGINGEVYDLKKLSRALRGMIGCNSKRVNESKSVMLFKGDHVQRINELLGTFGFT